MSQLPASLLSWIESVIGVPVVGIEELTGGASRSSYIVTGGDGAKMFLRRDAGDGPLSGTQFTLAREYGVLEFLQGKTVPVAKTHAYSPDHDAILMEFVPGVTSYQKSFAPAEEAALQRELIEAVVALQQLDPSQLTGLGAYCAAPLAEAIPSDLEVWAELYRQNVTPRDPLLEFALNWLKSDVPDAASAPVLVHGDIGPGNFLVSDGRIRALIDWEMVRVGHPLEDVACIIARGLGAPFGSPRQHIENYEQSSGAPVDLRKLDYALALVLTRWTIAISMALARPTAQQNVPMLFAFRQINSRALVDALCRYYGISAADQLFSFPAREKARVPVGYSLDYLEQLASAGPLDGADRYKLRGVMDLIAYLKSLIDYGPETYEMEETDRIGALIGGGISSHDARAAICDYAGSVRLADALPLVEYLRWRTAREQAIMRTSLNERADNVIAY
jgi:aminoglycoside phosphotransferase (APT) family kinase protein